MTACSRPAPSGGDVRGAPAPPAPASAAAEPAPADAASNPPADAAPGVGGAADPPLPPGATPCEDAGAGPTCLRFASVEDAFRWVLAFDPTVLAIGEAHAQKGTEALASSTKRFTDKLLPIVSPRASDLVVELWAPDPRCQKEVKAVASAQKPVTSAQAAPTQNEYVTLGTRAKERGVTPWLLRPTCDDFSTLADAGADAVPAMLSLVKRLTAEKVRQLLERQARAEAPKMVLAYGGAMHNDLAPADDMKDYSFGPELELATGDRYVELDLIVPEFVKDTPSWERLPWVAAFRAGGGPNERATLYRTGSRSFVLLFPRSR